MKIIIQCPKGHIFAASVKEHIDIEWKAQELYYQRRGCKVIEVESFSWSECDCRDLKHDFDKEQTN